MHIRNFPIILYIKVAKNQEWGEETKERKEDINCVTVHRYTLPQLTYDNTLCLPARCGSLADSR